jgi:hypothetical protein
MKNRFLVLLIACLWCWAPLAQLRALPLTVFLGGSPPSNDYTVNTATFNGSSYLRVEAGGDVGWADGTTFTIAGWIGPTSVAATQFIYSGSTSSALGKIEIFINSSAQLRARGDSTTGTDGTDYAFQLTSATTITAGVWTHFHLCVDTGSSANTKLFFNGVEDTSLTETTLSGTIDMAYTGDRFTVGGSVGGSPTSLFSGWMAELWINDSLVSDNALFYSGGNPVSLGANGETPTGATPAHYFSSNGSGNSWLNMGTAGGTAPSFAVTGSLGTTTSP